jgi:hypothetical protein
MLAIAMHSLAFMEFLPGFAIDYPRPQPESQANGTRKSIWVLVSLEISGVNLMESAAKRAMKLSCDV